MYTYLSTIQGKTEQGVSDEDNHAYDNGAEDDSVAIQAQAEAWHFQIFPLLDPYIWQIINKQVKDHVVSSANTCGNWWKLFQAPYCKISQTCIELDRVFLKMYLLQR